MNEAVRRGRHTLLLLAVVFLGPMGVAMALYFSGFQWRPDGSTAHGELYEPVRPLPRLQGLVAADGREQAVLRGKWTLLYIGSGACETPCREALVATRQVRRALGRDLVRVQRAYLAPHSPGEATDLASEHPDLVLVSHAADVAAVVAITGAAQAGDVFLADPLGNLVMRYPAGSPMKGLHADLQRLLKISTIG
jgi:hypothetical protein